MENEFLKSYFEDEKYLQNEPLTTKQFVDFCKKRGIETNESELEFFEKNKLLYPIFRIERVLQEEEMVEFEKDNQKFCRPAHYGLEKGEKEVRRYNTNFYSHYGFDEYSKESLLDLYYNKNLFDPSSRSFEEWSNFKDENLELDNEKIISFYSSYQIFLLKILKKEYSLKFNFSYESWNKKPIENFDMFIDELNNKQGSYKDFFDFKEKNLNLIKSRKNFDRVIEFLLSIDYIFAPYGKSSLKSVSVQDTNWNKKRSKFNAKEELDKLNFKIEEVINIYDTFSKSAIELLGRKRDDWIQLWKRIAWEEKDKLDGQIRLGIEYLQWALMLKKFLIEYRKKDFLDVDELTSIATEDMIKIDPENMDGHRGLLRAHRNEVYNNPEINKNYYHDTYKRLFYLANDLELNYQPRIMVFVEGETEKELFPKIFNWYYMAPENLGIEIVNFRGVDKLISTAENARELKNLVDNLEKYLREKVIPTNSSRKFSDTINFLKKTDITFSNWTSLISYNLQKWQIIPFFVSDNEGKVKNFLDFGKSIRLKEKNYNIPQDWKYLWGVNNENKPFYGNNFEFANFSDKEIQIAIKQVIGVEVDINKIKEIRNKEAAIKKINSKIDKSKRKIVKTLFDNLFSEYKRTNDPAILERPIFRLIGKLIKLSHSNPPPVNTKIEIINQNYFFDLLNKDE